MRLTNLNELIEDGKKLKGKWRLGKDGELQYRSTEEDEEIKLKAPLVAAEPGALVVSMTDYQSDRRSTTHLAKLTGAWKADAKNRLVFEAERESGKKDELTFQGLWELNENQQAVYRLKRTALKTRQKLSRELVFSGFWELSGKNRLTYRFYGNDASAFSLRGAFQTKSILAKKGEIRYQLGAEVSRTLRTRSLTFFGRWVVSKDFGLSFELENTGKRPAILTFSGDVRLNEKNQVSTQLKTQNGRPLGVELILTREIFGTDGSAFLRLKKSLEESRVEAGVALRW